jgi:hypothetical protein
MGLATVHANLRSAFRERLLTLVDIDHSPGVSVSLASGVFTRASGSWLTAGFAPGMEVTVSGFTGSPLYGVVETVSALALKLNITGTQTVAGGGRFIVGLPQGRAWEGFDFFPVDGRPYVSESVRANATTLETICNPSGVGVATNILEASATFFYPKNKGTLAIERMAGAAMKLLGESPRRLSYGGDAATIQRVERSQLYDDGSRIGCAVTARLMAITTS